MKTRTRKAANRSRMERCAICNEFERLVEHHIKGRDIYQPNHPSNLCYICDNCHRRIHDGFIVVDGWLMTSDGIKLTWEYRDGN